MSRGVAHPRHTDLERYHAAHPRHRTTRQPPRSKPYQTARAAQGHFNHTSDTGMELNDVTSHTPHGDNCTYILDSGAHSSHITDPSSLQTHRPVRHKTKPATIPIVQCTHARQTTISTNKGHKLKYTAVVSPNINRHLLSVQAIAKTHGNVLFTPEAAYLFDKNSPSSAQPRGTLPSARKHRNQLVTYEQEPHARSTPAAHAENPPTTVRTQSAQLHHPSSQAGPCSLSFQKRDPIHQRPYG